MTADSPVPTQMTTKQQRDKVLALQHAHALLRTRTTGFNGAVTPPRVQDLIILARFILDNK